MPTRSKTPFDLVVVVPHTHWDREWYEPVVRTRQRLVALIDDLMDVLEGEPAIAVFMLDGQLSTVDDYLDVRPEQGERLTRLISDGRILVGPWYVLADELLTSGEAMVRNLLLGASLGRRYGGRLCLGYSPDAFGHPATLPTLLNGFGIRDAIVWRGYGGGATHQSSLFHWEGPDGSAVRTFHLPRNGYEYGAELPEDSGPLRHAWRRIRSALSERNDARVALILNGADHHALQPQIHRIVAKLREIEPGTEFRIGSPIDFFAACPAGSELPTVRGELRDSTGYAWSLQGVHATRTAMKSLIAEGERLLVRWAEPQAALTQRDRRPLLQHAWRDHVRNCAHDSIGGCCADDVAGDIAARAGAVVRAAQGIFLDAVRDRLGQDPVVVRRHPAAWRPTLAVVNPSPAPRAGVIEATVALFRHHVVVGGPGPVSRPHLDPSVVPSIEFDGCPCRVQVLEHTLAYDRFDSPRNYPDQDVVQAVRVVVEVPSIPALGIRCGAVGDRGTRVRHGKRVTASGGTVSSREYRIRSGSSRGFQLQRLETGAYVADFARIESVRDIGDTYTSQRVPGDRARSARMERGTAVWPGPLAASIARNFEIRDRVRGTIHLRLDAGSSLVRILVEGENLTGDHKVRLVFPAGDSALVDMPFGSVHRARVLLDPSDQTGELPVTTGPMHRFVHCPNGDATLTVFARGLFEYELLPTDEVAITLFRATGLLSRPDLHARPGHAAWPGVTPDAQQLGAFRAEIGVLPLAPGGAGAAPVRATIERAAEEFHAPLTGWMLRQAVAPPGSLSGPELVGEGLSFSALKSAETDGAIAARCVNVTDEYQRGGWRWHRPATRAVVARLDETPLDEVELEEEGRLLPFDAPPRGVITMLVWS